MVHWITKDIEVTTLRYQTIDDMIGAIGLPRENLCLYCWTGRYFKGWPEGKEVEETSRSVEELIAQD